MHSNSTLKTSTTIFSKTIASFLLLFFLALQKPTAQVYVNGNLSTGATASSGESAPAGTTWSEVQTGNSTGGYASGIAAGFTVADDFTVPTGGTWNISSLTFYAYSTNYTGTNSPFDDLKVQIFDTDPSVGNPTPIFGDLTTNRLTSSSSANMYRIFNATANTNRAIWELNASLSLSLTGGHYWIEWQTGTAQTSNFSPPSTVAGTVTQPGNNAIQHTLSGNTWAPILDGPNASDPQDMPFKINYTCIGAATITTQPVDQTVCLGTPATFSCVATGAGLSYQWQVSTDGGATFTDLVAATSATYTTPPVTSAMSLNIYHVIVVSPCGYIVSNDAHLFVVDIPLITTQPVGGAVCSGDSYTMSVTATGLNVEYQWEYSPLDCVSGFVAIAGATAASFTTPAITNTGYYRCKITNGCGGAPIYTDCATISVSAALSIVTQPADQQACSGANALFSVVASIGSANYQWQVSSTGCAGVFSNMVGEISSTLSLPAVTAAQNGSAYRCMVSSSCAAAITSDCATLTVNSFGITTQPADQNVCDGSTAVFMVVTSGSNINYQWQESTNNGITYNDIPGATADNVSIPNVNILYNGYKYRVKITSSSCPNQIISDAATLSITMLTMIVNQPNDQTGCENVYVEFAIDVQGQATYQWQVSTNNGPFVDLPGETNFMLGLTTNASMNGNRYHVVVTGTVCTAIIVSNDANLTVNPNPVLTITANPSNTSLLPGQSTLLTAAVSPAGSYIYSWQADGGDITGASGNSYTVNYGEAATYTASVLSVAGNCASTSNEIIVTDSADGGKFAIYSNPNNGVFTVAYPNLPAQSNISVIDSHGQRVYLRENLPANQPVHVDVHSAPSGVYTVALYDAGLGKLVTGKVVIIH